MLNIDSDKISQYQKDMTGILKAFQLMESVNTENVKPLMSILDQHPIITHQEGSTINNDHESILQHTSNTFAGFYAVPKQVSSATTSSNNKNPNNNSFQDEGDDF
eukprot:gene3840-4784_t